MAGWHHWLDGCESEWTPGVGDGQGGLECCNSWGRKESDTTERLNWTELTEGYRIYELHLFFALIAISIKIIVKVTIITINYKNYSKKKKKKKVGLFNLPALYFKLFIRSFIYLILSHCLSIFNHSASFYLVSIDDNDKIFNSNPNETASWKTWNVIQYVLHIIKRKKIN